MADYSDDDARYAGNIVQRLLGEERQFIELEEALVISDLETDAVAFAEELELLKDFDADVPAVRLAGEELVPVALSLLPQMGWAPPFPGRVRGRKWWRRNPWFHEWAHDYARALDDELGPLAELERMPRDQARSTFVRRATDFLATRVAAIRDFRGRDSGRWSRPSFLNVSQRVRGPRVSTPGCHFTVSSNSSGLRVFWSGAYRISPNYFSHPTTPTLGVLQSGTYVFGVDGGAYGNDVQWDLNAVIALPGTPHAHLNF
ncbi:MAG TPA: hypothetical protein VGA70_00525 [Longimicrobiales bacterium]